MRTGARASACAALRPPKPPPMMTTWGHRCMCIGCSDTTFRCEQDLCVSAPPGLDIAGHDRLDRPHRLEGQLAMRRPPADLAGDREPVGREVVEQPRMDIRRPADRDRVAEPRRHLLEHALDRGLAAAPRPGML